MEKFEEILELIEEKRFSAVKAALSEINAADAAEIFHKLEPENVSIVFCLLGKDEAADVFSYLDPDTQEIVINSISDKQIAQLLSNLFYDDAADMIDELPANVVARVLKNADEETRIQINHLLSYGDDTAGSIMTTEFVDLKETLTAEQALDVIYKKAYDKETIYTCYVKDSHRKLTGIVTVRRLLKSKPDALVSEIMEPNFIFADTGMNTEELVNLFTKYGLTAIPIVDKEQRIVGIVTVDDAMRVMQKEVTEDFQRMAATAPSDKPYLKTGVFKLVINRLPWLVVLMFASMVTGFIMEGYSSALAILPLLTAFVPMLMDGGGNAAAQSSTLITRGIAVGEIRKRDAGRVLWKEIRVSLFCIIPLALFVFLRVLLLTSPDKMIMDDGSSVGTVLNLAIGVACALSCTVLSANILGGLLPIGAKAIKMDPAVMASPLLTTVLDSSSLLIYFGFMMLFLNL